MKSDSLFQLEFMKLIRLYSFIRKFTSSRKKSFKYCFNWNFFASITHKLIVIHLFSQFYSYRFQNMKAKTHFQSRYHNWNNRENLIRRIQETTIKIQSNTWSQPQINFTSIVSGFALTNQWPIKVAINFPACDNISALSFNINNLRWLSEDRGVLNKFACIKSDTTCARKPSLDKLSTLCVVTDRKMR